MSDNTRSIEEVVSKYLRQNPDFLEKQPALLKHLELSHASGPAVSLIERQVQYLRQQNEALEQQHNQLIQVASDNEKLMYRLHQLTLELMSMGDLPSFFDRLSKALLTEFKADILNITLFDLKIEAGPKTPLHHVRRDDPELQQFQEHLDKGHSVCGRLNRNKRDHLFGSRAQWVESMVLVPMGEGWHAGHRQQRPGTLLPRDGNAFP